MCSSVGLLYDDRMLATCNLWVPGYPENPKRLEGMCGKMQNTTRHG